MIHNECESDEDVSGQLNKRARHREGVKANERLVLLTFWSVPALDAPVSLHLIALICCIFYAKTPCFRAI